MPRCCPCASSVHLAEDDRELEARYTAQERVLGMGARGGVLEGTCKRTGRMVAIKTYIKPEMSKKDQKNMRVELQIHRSLKHPSIVELLDIFETRTKVQIVMEQLQGGELFERVQADGPLGEEEVARQTLHLLRALAYLHARKVVHRDIKMENLIFATPGGQLKLIDFGLAGILGSSGRITQTCGTLGYVAPEVLNGGYYTESVDLWSLGAVVYGMLTGHGLFDGDDEAMYKANIANQIKWSSRFAELPTDCQTFLRQLLSADPQVRPSVLQAVRHPWLRRVAPEEAARADKEAMQTATDAEQECDSLPRSASLKERLTGGTSVFRRSRGRQERE